MATKRSAKRMADGYEMRLAGVNASLASRMAVGRVNARVVAVDSIYADALDKAASLAHEYYPARVEQGANYVLVVF